MSNIVDDREETHGNAWALMGVALQPLIPELIKLIQKHPKYVFAWFMILNKLIRIFAKPDYVDHWIDIQGYAELIIRDIKGKEKTK